MSLAQKLKERRIQRQASTTPLLGMRQQLTNLVKEEVGKFKTEIIQELKKIELSQLKQELRRRTDSKESS